jgi:hypothetical protein
VFLVVVACSVGRMGPERVVATSIPLFLIVLRSWLRILAAVGRLSGVLALASRGRRAFGLCAR